MVLDKLLPDTSSFLHTYINAHPTPNIRKGIHQLNAEQTPKEHFDVPKSTQLADARWYRAIQSVVT
jgi:hypothetical protein